MCSDPAATPLADELAAMANTRDGVLVLGVEDQTREVVGIPIEQLDTVEQYVFAGSGGQPVPRRELKP